MKKKPRGKKAQKQLGFVNFFFFFGEVPIAPYCWLFHVFFCFLFFYG